MHPPLSSPPLPPYHTLLPPQLPASLSYLTLADEFLGAKGCHDGIGVQATHGCSAGSRSLGLSGENTDGRVGRGGLGGQHAQDADGWVGRAACAIR